MDDFSVRVHHKGRFCSDKDKTEYIDGEVTTSVIEAYDVVGKLGYITENIEVLWYKDTELELEGLKLLKGDEEAMEMANIGVEKKVVDLYVVHKVSVPDDFCEDIGYLDVGDSSKVVEEECVDAKSGPSDIRQAQNIEVEAQGGGADMEAQIKEEDDTDDPDYEANSDLHFSDSEDDYCGDDGLFDVDITLGEMHQDIRKSKESKSAVEKLKKTQKVAVEKRKSSHLSDDEGLNSDELEEVSSEDDEASKKKFHVHKELNDMSKYKWESETLYATREEFKEAVTSYAAHTGRNIKFSVVDNVRVRAKCGDGYEWFAYAVKMANEDSWQLRTVNDQHSCNTVFDIKVTKSKWLAKVFRRKVEENPKLKLGTIQSRTLRKWNVQISRAKTFWAKQIALKTAHPDVMPPPHRVPIGRLKKKRARGEGEEPQGQAHLGWGYNKNALVETTAATSSASPAQNDNVGTATASPAKHNTTRKAGSTGSVYKRTKLANPPAGPNTQPSAHKKFQPPRPTRILRSNSTSTAKGQPSSQGSQTQSAFIGDNYINKFFRVEYIAVTEYKKRPYSYFC
ncbi:hypothetical protein Ahy_A08g039534 [Arachis hypogaea]|uniref:PB1-like domain-containing protein n=1 Tax=Arachis hypogaea TaxID=3818 RepID=A0A445BWK3_ARAHY|nr:hypothetical protein Ahy_A08g039534 [Arachis hypogaea]